MFNMVHFVFGLLLVFSCQEDSDKIMACGSNKVIIVDTKKTQEKDTPELYWQWSPQDSKALPKDYQEKYLNKIDECKITKDGKAIMITSSSGGVAIIDMESKQSLFYTKIGNPHSIEELPNNMIAVAASYNKNGNCVALYKKDFSEKEPVFKDSLFGAHGLYWDKKEQLLYALGQNILRAYKLTNWSDELPKIKIQKQWDLPGTGGHDLTNYDVYKLIITTYDDVWLFNNKTQRFKRFLPLESTRNVKAISVNNNNRIAYIKAEESWWSHHIYLTNPNEKVTFPNINLYKVRWLENQ